MVNKKQTKKHPISPKKLLKVLYHVLVIISIIVLTLVVISQQKVMESFAEQQFKDFVSDIDDNFFQDLSIDAPDKKAYVPQAELRFDYNNLASNAQYKLFPSDEVPSSVKATIGFIERYQMIDTQYSVEEACTTPYVISVGEEIPEDYTSLGSKVLDDGRNVEFASSLVQACRGYVTGLSGKEFLNFLKAVQSY